MLSLLSSSSGLSIATAPSAAQASVTTGVASSSGVKVLPGSYLSRDTDPRLGGGNPGAGYVRAALVAPAADVARGLHAIRAQIEAEREL